MAVINLSNVKGTPPYNVYVSDQYGNNKNLIATIDQNVPPKQKYTLPDIFDGIEKIMLTITDSSGCDYCNFFKILECRFGCSFNVFIEPVGCSFDIIIDKKGCEVNMVSIG